MKRICYGLLLLIVCTCVSHANICVFSDTTCVTDIVLGINEELRIYGNLTLANGVNIDATAYNSKILVYGSLTLNNGKVFSSDSSDYGFLKPYDADVIHGTGTFENVWLDCSAGWTIGANDNFTFTGTSSELFWSSIDISIAGVLKFQNCVNRFGWGSGVDVFLVGSGKLIVDNSHLYPVTNIYGEAGTTIETSGNSIIKMH